MSQPDIPSTQKGGTLLEPLIAIVILSFGLLGIAQFQLNMLAQAANSRSRLTATSLADELLAQVRVDPANAGCYATDPPANSCGYAAALQTYKDWELKAKMAMTRTSNFEKSLNQVTVKSTLDQAASQMNVTITWKNKGSEDTHGYTVITDVRP